MIDGSGLTVPTTSVVSIHYRINKQESRKTAQSRPNDLTLFRYILI